MSLENLKEKGRRMGRKALDLADRVGDAAVDVATDFHKNVQERGGYIAASRKAISSLVESTRDAYRSLENNYFPDGKFDYEKAKEDLADFGSAASTYGKKAAKTLGDLATDAARQGYENLKDFKDKYVPTDEELLTKYSGIGTDYNFMLFRQHYEGCLKFYSEAENKIGKSKYKGEILNDIKASASENIAELREYYAGKVAHGDSLHRANYISKLNAIEKYFK